MTDETRRPRSFRRCRPARVAGAAALSLAAVSAPAAAAPPDADASASEAQPAPGQAPKREEVEKKLPPMKRWKPERNLVEIGLFGGAFLAADRHDLYDPKTRPAEPLWKGSADIGARLGYYPLSFLGLEGEFAAIPTAVRNIRNDFAFVYSGRGHVILQLPMYRVAPFLLGGGGALGVSSRQSALGKDVDPAAHYGAGVKGFITKLIQVRAEFRHIMSAQAAEQRSVQHHFELLVGVTFTLNRYKPKPPPPPDPDRDDDGFLNVDDSCPDKPGIAPDGCPAKDSDGDGFVDPDDDCPEVPGVAPDGCPIPDTDGDGFLDPDDTCPEEPETKNGFEDQDGCPDELPKEIKEFTGVIEGIEFDFNKATIRPSSKPTLDKAIKVLKEFPDIRVEISGHTDDVGTREHNLELSKERAQAVRDYLVKGGVDTARVETRGAGPDEPLVPNDNDENRAKNRRTEFKVLFEN